MNLPHWLQHFPLVLPILQRRNPVANVLSSVLTEAANIALTLTVDQAELAAGEPVSLPKVQVGSVGGKAIYLEAVLSTT